VYSFDLVISAALSAVFDVYTNAFITLSRSIGFIPLCILLGYYMYVRFWALYWLSWLGFCFWNCMIDVTWLWEIIDWQVDNLFICHFASLKWIKWMFASRITGEWRLRRVPSSWKRTDQIWLASASEEVHLIALASTLSRFINRNLSGASGAVRMEFLKIHVGLI
jgi:hypothetical protein